MLLDTSGLLCCLNAMEPYHANAVRLFRAAGPMLTHSYVLAEFTTLAHARGLSRKTTYDFTNSLLANLHLEVVWVDVVLHRQALNMLRARPDKNYLLCDVVSFVLMRERDITDALTTDHHFEQEGFTRLLTP